MIGDLFARLARGETLAEGEINSLQTQMDQIQNGANLAASWTDNMGQISSLAYSPPVKLLARETFTENTTAFSLPFPGTEYNMVMFFGAFHLTNAGTTEPGSIYIHFNNERTSASYQIMRNYAYSSQNTSGHADGVWFYTSGIPIAAIGSTELGYSMETSAYDPFWGVVCNPKSTGWKCGWLTYSQRQEQFGRWSAGFNHFWSHSTEAVVSFDFNQLMPGRGSNGLLQQW